MIQRKEKPIVVLPTQRTHNTAILGAKEEDLQRRLRVLNAMPNIESQATDDKEVPKDVIINKTKRVTEADTYRPSH